MRDYKNRYSQPQYRNSYSNESDMEMNPEFEMESEYDPNYEMEGSFGTEGENDFESDYELQPEFDMEEEADYESQYDRESQSDYETNEFEQQDETSQDEMETELEYVADEMEFESWVKKVVSRDHRRLSPVLRTPLGRKAIRQFSKIAFRTLPFIGRRRQGWKRPNQYRRPYSNRYWHAGNRRWQYRQPWRPGMPMQPFQDPNMMAQPQNFPGSDMSQQPQPFQNTDGQQQPQIQPDGSFKNFVLDTIKNLSDQIARGNESITALKNSMTNSAVNNFPAIVQPKSDSPDQPAPNSQMPPVGDTMQKDPAQTGEYEFESDYEYDNENNYQYQNETDGEVADSESSFSEETEMELASELLSINNEMELDHFLGKLLKRAVGGLSQLMKSPGGALLKKGFLKILGTALPVVGGVVGGPIGAQVGGTIGSVLSKDPADAKELFDLELEGLSNEDSEFEIAKAFIRFAGNAAKEANDGETGNPVKDAELGMIRSARRFAPGLIRRRNHGYGQSRFQDRYNQNDDDNSGMGDNGRWYRRGNKIIIQNAF